MEESEKQHKGGGMLLDGRVPVLNDCRMCGECVVDYDGCGSDGARNAAPIEGGEEGGR